MSKWSPRDSMYCDACGCRITRPTDGCLCCEHGHKMAGGFIFAIVLFGIGLMAFLVSAIFAGCEPKQDKVEVDDGGFISIGYSIMEIERMRRCTALMELFVARQDALDGLMVTEELLDKRQALYDELDLELARAGCDPIEGEK